MHLEWDEGVSLLKKFVLERSLLRTVYLSRSGAIQCSQVGQLASAEEDGKLWVFVGNESEDEVRFLLNNDCQFDYCDARDAPEHVREAAGHKFEGQLTVGYPDTGECIHLFEMRL